MEKLRVVWLCHFSNEEVRGQMHFSISLSERWGRKLIRHSLQIHNQSDYAQWITNGIDVMKTRTDIELYVISPHKYLQKRITELCIDNVHYYFFKPSNVSILAIFYNKIFRLQKHSFRQNTKIIKKIIKKIDPDIINLFGPENTYYAISALSINTNRYPLLVSLQTLMNHPTFRANKGMSEYLFRERSNVEKLILKCTNYISTGVIDYGKYIFENINPNTYIFKGSLAVAESIDMTICEKVFDFVFFASNVSKGLEEAVESFILVKKNRVNVTMNIIGGISDVQRDYIYDKLKINQTDNSAIEISGRLKTHDDVLNEIKRARIAVLPLKTDYVSGTIREAMSRGVPVVSTITEGTPSLNEKRESILLSKIGDYQAMADNMIKLLDSPEYANRIRENAFVTLEEKYNNKAVIDRTIVAYKAIVDFHQNGTPIPEDIGQKNPIKNN